MMNHEQLNVRYVKVCRAHGVDIAVCEAEKTDAPRYTVMEQGEKLVITLNTASIAPGEYERCLAWAVSEALLPRLVLHTERLTIRRFVMGDAAGCFPFMSDVQGMLLDGCKPFAEMDEAYAERMQLLPSARDSTSLRCGKPTK